MTDPMGHLPVQMRGDALAPDAGTPVRVVDGLNPHLTEDEPVTGGTLPPV